MLVSVRGVAHTVSTIMEVIHVVIYLIQAADLFFNPEVKSTFIGPHTCV